VGNSGHHVTMNFVIHKVTWYCYDSELKESWLVWTCG